MIEPRHVSPAMRFSSMGRQLYLYVFEEGEGLARHEHQYPHDLLVTSGVVLVAIGPMEKRLGPGDTIRFPDGAVHGVIALAKAGVISVFDEALMTEEDRQLGREP